MSETVTEKNKRPLVITIVGILLILTALYGLILGTLMLISILETETLNAATLLAPADSPEVFTYLGDEVLSAIILIATGLVQLIICIGFWRTRRWAWVAAITWQALKLLLGLAASFFVDAAAFSVVFSVILVFLLNAAEVRYAFGIRTHENESNNLTPLNALDRK